MMESKILINKYFMANLDRINHRVCFHLPWLHDLMLYERSPKIPGLPLFYPHPELLVIWTSKWEVKRTAIAYVTATMTEEMLEMPLMVLTLEMIAAVNSTQPTMECSSAHQTLTMTNTRPAVPTKISLAGGWTNVMQEILMADITQVRLLMHNYSFISNANRQDWISVPMSSF